MIFISTPSSIGINYMYEAVFDILFLRANNIVRRLKNSMPELAFTLAYIRDTYTYYNELPQL